MFEKTDNVVVIIPEKYGEMYGIYLSTLAAWTGKGNAYMVYNYDDPIYDQDASNKEVTLRASLRNSLGVDRSAFKATHVNLYAENRQCSFKALFAKNLSVWRNANMVYALDQLGVTALVESQNMVARQVRLDKDRMLASAYAYDHCAYVRGQSLAQCLRMTRCDIAKEVEPNFAGESTADRLKYFSAKNAKTLEVIQYRTGHESYGGNDFWGSFKGDYEYQSPTNVTSKNYALPGACWMDDDGRPHYLYCSSNGSAAEIATYRNLALKLFGNTVEFNAIMPNGRRIG